MINVLLFSARHCFSLDSFIKHVAMTSLIAAYNKDRSTDTDTEVEAAARFTCHLLLRLFKTVECPQPALYSVSTSPHPLPSGNPRGYSIKLSCDRHLLSATHNNIPVGPVLAVLKAILVVADVTANKQPPKKPELPMLHSKGGPGSVNVTTSAPGTFINKEKLLVIE